MGQCYVHGLWNMHQAYNSCNKIDVKKFLVLIFILPSLVFSQIEGNINGYIYDSKSQLPILGANIIIEGTQKVAISDENGFFEIYKINPQSYNLY